MQDSPLKSYLFHSLSFLAFNLLIVLMAFQKGSFYGLIGYLGVLGSTYSIAILAGILAKKYLKSNELLTSIISGLSISLFIILMTGFQAIFVACLLPLAYFFILELPRISIIRLNKPLINQSANFISRLLPFIVLLHFLLIAIGLVSELPTIYGQWKYLIIEVPLLCLITWLNLKNSSLGMNLKKALRITLIVALSSTILSYGYYLHNRSVGRSQLEQSYQLFERGDFQLVARKTENILRTDPYNANAMFLLGCSLTELSKFEEADKQFLEILINPNTGKGLSKEQLDLIYFRRSIANYGEKKQNKLDSIKGSNQERLQQLILIDLN